MMLAMQTMVAADGQHPSAVITQARIRQASSTRRSLPDVGEFPQTQFMTACARRLPLRSPDFDSSASLYQAPGSRRKTQWAVSGLQSPADLPGADASGKRSAASRPLRRGHICGLVYASVRASIAGHQVALTTPDDERGRAETVILAPEKRKVGSSILPLTTTLTAPTCV